MDTLVLALRVVLSLACVLALMWFAQRRLGRRGQGGRRRGELEVVARQGVGGKAQVVLLEAGGTRFLLGVTEHQVSVLHAADAPLAASFEQSLTAAVDADPTLLPVDSLRGAKGWAAGSLLDAGTWKAAAAAVTGRNKAA